MPLKFGVFELVLESGELRKAGARVRLAPQPFTVLAMLAARPGEVVSRDELRTALWGDNTFIEFDQGLNTCIRQIRAVLGDDADVPRYIETVPRRGYRLIVPVQAIGTPVAVATIPEVVDVAVASSSPPQPSPSPSPSRRHWLWLGTTVLLVAAIVAVIGWPAMRGRDPQLRSPGKPVTLAVLPLANLSNDAEQDYLVDGVTEALIHNLAQIRALRVISRTSVLRYKQTKLALGAIARELNADLVIEGSFQQSADRVRLTLQLVEGSTDHHLFSRTFETTVDRLFDTQRQIAREIATAVAVEITPAERDRLSATRVVTPEAYRSYLLGRHFWNRRSLDSLRLSVTHFSRAIELDSGFAEAHAALAQTYVLLGDEEYAGIPTREASRLTHETAARALKLDPGLGSAHAARGLASFQFDWDWPGAEREFTQALALEPQSATTYGWYGWFLLSQGRFAEAIEAMARARALDPLSLTIASSTGDFYYFARQYDEAIAAYDAALTLDPGYNGALIWRGRALEMLGRRHEALAQYNRVLAAGFDLRAAVAAVRVQAALGDPRGARARFDELRSRKIFIPSVSTAYLQLGIGDLDAAFEALDRAVADRSSSLLYLLVSPVVDSLRGDPRFIALVRRVNPALETLRLR